MAEKVIAGKTVNVNEEGYLTDHSQWTREIAAAIAADLKIELNEDHWKVMDFLQKDAVENKTSPTIRRLKKIGGIDIKLLYSLYPDGPLKKATKIAGLLKPVSCI